MKKIIILSLTILSLNLWAEATIKYVPGQADDNLIPTETFGAGRNTNAAVTVETNLDNSTSAQMQSGTIPPGSAAKDSQTATCPTCQDRAVLLPEGIDIAQPDIEQIPKNESTKKAKNRN